MALKYTFTNNDFYNKKKINTILIKSNFNDSTFKVSSNVLNQELDYNKSLSVNSDLTSDELSKYVSADTIVEYENIEKTRNLVNVTQSNISGKRTLYLKTTGEVPFSDELSQTLIDSNSTYILQGTYNTSVEFGIILSDPLSSINNVVYTTNNESISENDYIKLNNQLINPSELNVSNNETYFYNRENQIFKFNEEFKYLDTAMSINGENYIVIEFPSNISLKSTDGWNTNLEGNLYNFIYVDESEVNE